MLARLTTITLGCAFTALALAAPSHAAFQTFGSDLRAEANVTEMRQQDTAYWQTTFANGSSPVAPAAGQIRSFKIKGIALSNPVPGVPGGETLFHLQALQPLGGGQFRILRSSQGFNVPNTGDPQQISTYVPANFCVAPGEVLAFNTIGGFDGIGDGSGPYPQGTPLRIFSSVTGALVSQFSGHNATNNGDVLAADSTRGQNEELLMQLTMGTGADATGLCPGGTAGLNLPPPPQTPPPPPPPSSLLRPVAGKSVVARVISGVVYVQLPRGFASPRARPALPGFVPLKGAAVLPVGSMIDTRKGRIALTSAAALPRNGVTKTQRAQFYSGIFQIKQRRAKKLVTDIVLRKANLARSCRSTASAAAFGFGLIQRATSRRRVISRLGVNGKGRYRTRGRNSTATVRGTIWLTEERCDGTLTRVRRGVVRVFDRNTGRSVTLRAGQSYLARAKRAAVKRGRP